jgi:hypothetical protein
MKPLWPASRRISKVPSTHPSHYRFIHERFNTLADFASQVAELTPLRDLLVSELEAARQQCLLFLGDFTKLSTVAEYDEDNPPFELPKDWDVLELFTWALVWRLRGLHTPWRTIAAYTSMTPAGLQRKYEPYTQSFALPAAIVEETD